MARRFDEAFRPLDLTNGQFLLLMSFNRPQPPSVGSVASLSAMDRTTLTAALKPLVGRGLVTISIDKKDRRSRLFTIRPAGRTLLAKAFPVWRRAHPEGDKSRSSTTTFTANPRQNLSTIRGRLMQKISRQLK